MLNVELIEEQLRVSEQQEVIVRTDSSLREDTPEESSDEVISKPPVTTVVKCPVETISRPVQASRLEAPPRPQATKPRPAKVMSLKATPKPPEAIVAKAKKKEPAQAFLVSPRPEKKVAAPTEPEAAHIEAVPSPECPAESHAHTEPIAFIDIPELETEKPQVTYADLETVLSPEGNDSFLAMYAEDLAPEHAEAARELLDQISTILEELPTMEELAIEDRAAVIIKLEDIVTELLERVGLEADETTIKQLVANLMATAHKAEEEADIDIDTLNYLGTREYRPADPLAVLGSLPHQLRQTLNPSQLLGQYAVQVYRAAA